MAKYKINKEYFPFSKMAPPIRNAKIAGFLGERMKAPRWIYKDKEITTTKYSIESYLDKEINVLVMEPKNSNSKLNALVYYHGGGFFFGGAGYHYKLCKKYALDLNIKVIFVQYRLAPKNPFPIPVMDCYNALLWTYNNADMLNINKNKIAVAGDSAGGSLAAGVCLMSRDNNTYIPYFQLLIYPVTDIKMETESNKKFTDTPIWNSKLSIKMWNGYVTDRNVENICYASPIDALDFTNLPQAYIETAEYDCLHDEGINYANILLQNNINVEINETIGTMHGYDTVLKAKTTINAINKRIEYMNRKFKEK